MSTNLRYDDKTGVYSSPFPAVSIPDDLSIDEFIFEYRPGQGAHSCSQGEVVPRSNPQGRLWLQDALNEKRKYTFEQARDRTTAIAKALHGHFGLGKRGDKPGLADSLGLFSGNDIDYPTACWAAFRLGAVVSGANPSYTDGELAYQLKVVTESYPIKGLIVHPETLPAAVKAVDKAKLSRSLIVLVTPPGPSASAELKELASQFPTLDDLVDKYRDVKLPPRQKLKAGESKTKIAFLSFSSGTTGLPKAVLIPHASLISNTLQSASFYHWTRYLQAYDPQTGKGDKALAVLPFFHIYGLVVVLHANLFCNVPITVLNKFTVPDFLGTIQRHRLTTLYVVPPMVVLLAKHPIIEKYDLSSFKKGFCGAAPLTDEIYQMLLKRFPDIIFGQGWGMTETSTVALTFDPREPAKIKGASAGILVPNINMKVVSPEGKLQPPGQIGELWSKSPSNAIGYLNNEKSSRETFDDEGYVHTGDEAYIDKDGWVFVVDRIKELIKVKGSQVAPAELEGHLLDHNDISDVCVIGIPDEYAGERPKAYVALRDEVAKAVKEDKQKAKAVEDSIKRFVADHKIDYKHLAEIEFIDAIPKTASGKLLRKDLRAMHAAKQKKSKL